MRPVLEQVSLPPVTFPLLHRHPSCFVIAVPLLLPSSLFFSRSTRPNPFASAFFDSVCLTVKLCPDRSWTGALNGISGVYESQIENRFLHCPLYIKQVFFLLSEIGCYEMSNDKLKWCLYVIFLFRDSGYRGADEHANSCLFIVTSNRSREFWLMLIKFCDTFSCLLNSYVCRWISVAMRHVFLLQTSEWYLQLILLF